MVSTEVTAPTRIDLKDLDPTTQEMLRTGLTYTDQKAQYQYLRFKKLGINWYDEDVYQEKLKEFKDKTKVCLLNQDNSGTWVLSGFRPYLESKLRVPVTSRITYPDPQLLPWDRSPAFQMHPYQAQALEKLLEVRHGGVQMGTGLGKSFIIANLVKRLGLKVVVMAPSSSITEQLLRDFTTWFGKKNVGAYYDGKKEVKKLITIGTAQSFTRIKPGSGAWKELQKTQVFIADESHLCPAKTLASVCFGLMAPVPYRFFFSATQMRNDGADLLLDGITGPIVYEMTVREGVDQGYLAKPCFKMFRAPMNGSFWSLDPNEMTRHHLFYNPHVIQSIARIANTAVTAGMPVLILIDEVEQFTKLLPYLRHRAGFAHGALNEDNRPKVPSEYHASDPNALVDEFNAGKLPILVGTSCISTGTDIKAVKLLVYWQGGKSEIQVKQAIGRATRLAPGKTQCHVVDFWVEDFQMDGNGKNKWGPVGRHAKVRHEIYNDLYGPVVDAELM